jgi:uncharacterized membrane protein SirB2
MQQTYVALLPAHMLLALVSPLLLSLQLWRGEHSATPRARRWRWLQPLSDALLLLSGLALAWIIQQFPFADAWLTAKLVGLVAYVAAGQGALWAPPRTRRRRAAWLSALASILYLYAVAFTQSPLPGL